MGKVTLADIAARAGLSKNTVSCAMRGSGRVSEETRQRVRAIAEEIGYRPNPYVSALMTEVRQGRVGERGSTIAFLTAYPTRDGWRTSPTFKRFHAGAKEAAAQAGFALEEFWLNDDHVRPQRLSQILLTRGIHGIIVCPPPQNRETILHQFDFGRFATATIGPILKDLKLHSASNHHFRTISTLLDELRRRNYRRIGLAYQTFLNERVDMQWQSGMLLYQSSLRRKDVVPILGMKEFSGERFLSWIEKHKPDAVISPDNAAWFALQKFGFSIPETMGYAQLSHRISDVAGMDHQPEQVGKAAFDLVAGQLNRNERGIPAHPKLVYIEGQFIDTPTLRSGDKSGIS